MSQDSAGGEHWFAPYDGQMPNCVYWLYLLLLAQLPLVPTFLPEGARVQLRPRTSLR